MKKIYTLFQFRHLLKLGFFSLLIFGLTGCFGVKPSSSKSAENLYISFFIGEKGTRYFIKPLVFKNKQEKQEISLDFTFQYKDEIKDSVVINYSVISPDFYKKADSLVIRNKQSKTVVLNNSHLFAESKKKHFVSRFSATHLLQDIYDLFQNHEWQISFYSNGKQYDFYSERKTQKSIVSLKNNVFILM